MKTNDILSVKKITPDAIIPTKANSTDLGYDLYVSEDTVIHLDGDVYLIPTGIAVKFPSGWGGFIKDRSSVATKNKFKTVAGVIDENYTGEIKVAITTPKNENNLQQSMYKIAKGTKIAQLVPIPTTNWDIVEVDELPTTDRGDKGFGSSGQ